MKNHARSISVLFQREFLGFFRTPVAYVFIILFLLLAIGLPWFVDGFFAAEQASLESFFRFLPWVFILFIPAVGMRLWSDEKRTGTVELLLTLPFTRFQAVVAKFLAAWAFVCLCVALTISFPLTVAYLGDPDWGAICGGYIGAGLLAAAMLGVCSAASATSKSQVIAFVLGVSFCMLLTLTGWSVFTALIRDLPVSWQDTIENFSFATRVQSFAQGLARPSDAVFLLSIAALGLAATIWLLETNRRRFLGMAIFVLNLIFLNLTVSALGWQWDLTEDKIYTLSDDSTELLAKQPEPILIEFYYSKSVEGLPISFKNFADRIERLLLQYERNSEGKAKVLRFDPNTNPTYASEAARLGIEARTNAEGESIYLGVAIHQGSRHEILPWISDRREGLLEYDLSRMIANLAAPQKLKLAIVSPLELFGAPDMPEHVKSDEDGTASWQITRELQSVYDVQEVPATAQSLPDETDLLLVVNPTRMPKHMGYTIDQYILSGGKALFLLDPFHYFESIRDRDDGMVIGEEYHVNATFPHFLETWGIELPSGKVVVDLELASQVPPAEGEPPIAFPPWVDLIQFDDRLPITAGMENLLLPFAGSLKATDRFAGTFTPIVSSSEASDLMDAAPLVNMHPSSISQIVDPQGKAHVLAAEIKGSFQTAFPEGRPYTSYIDIERNERVVGDTVWDRNLKQSEDSSQVIIVADADFIEDPIAYELVGRSGKRLLTRPRNDNSTFVLNALEYLAGANRLSGIRGKGKTLRPFLALKELESQAQERFVAEMVAIEQRLSKLAGEVDELNRSAGSAQNAQVTRAFLASIKRAEAEQERLERRRDEITAALRAAVDALELKLTLINLGFASSIVLICGILFIGRRGSGRRRPTETTKKASPL